MIEAGEVGAIFVLKDEASPVIELLVRQFNALQTTLDKVKASFAGLHLPRTVTAQIDKMGESLNATSIAASNLETALIGIGTAAQTGSDRAIGGFDRIDTAISTTKRGVSELRAEMRGIGNGMGGSRTIGPGGVNLPHGGRSGMFHVHQHGVTLPGGVTATPSSGGDGFWGWVAAFAGADAIKHLFESGGDLELQKKLLADKLGTSGRPGDIDAATRAAVAMAGNGGIIGTTPSENLKGIRELTSVVPNLPDAIALYPSLMKTAKSLEELTGQKADDNLKTLAKGLENLGGGINPVTHKIDPARMQVANEEALKTIIAGGGFIDTHSLFGLAKQAGGMGRLSDPGKLFDEIITSLIDMGGPRSGTALAALGRQFLGDKMTRQTANELTDLGILAKGSWRPGGGTGIIMNPGFDVKGIDQVKNGDIAGWFLSIVGPAIEARYGGADKMTTADLMQESYKLFGRQTGQRLGLMFLANEAQRQRDVALKNAVDPNSVYAGIFDKDLAANVNNLGAAITGFSQIVGSANVGPAISTIHAITATIHGLTGIAAANPPFAKSLFGTIFGPSLASGMNDAVRDITGLDAFGESVKASEWLWRHLSGISAAKASEANLPPADAAAIAGRRLQGRDPRSPVSGPLAYFPPPAPQVNVAAPNVDVKATTEVKLDGASIAAAITTRIERFISAAIGSIEGRVTKGTSGPDGQALEVYPDHFNH